MGYIFQFQDALHYDGWFASQPGSSAFALEKELLARVWAPDGPHTLLEVGCGTGLFLEWFRRLGHQVTGLDPSSPMLQMARRRLPGSVPLDHGFAEDLPYEDHSFDTVALITTLEFVEDPDQALGEAIRVARRHLLLGALNRYSLTTGYLLLARFWTNSVFRHARFFSVFHLQRMIRTILEGHARTRWKTCLLLPLWSLPYVQCLERHHLAQYSPFGHFVAMRVDLRYTLTAAQHTVFAELPATTGHVPLRSPCWRTPVPATGSESILDDGYRCRESC